MNGVGLLCLVPSGSLCALLCSWRTFGIEVHIQSSWKILFLVETASICNGPVEIYDGSLELCPFSCLSLFNGLSKSEKSLGMQMEWKVCECKSWKCWPFEKEAQVWTCESCFSEPCFHAIERMSERWRKITAGPIQVVLCSVVKPLVSEMCWRLKRHNRWHFCSWTGAGLASLPIEVCKKTKGKLPIFCSGTVLRLIFTLWSMMSSSF